nr:hypothetical protein [Tanacetum cinerariifolium]
MRWDYQRGISIESECQEYASRSTRECGIGGFYPALDEGWVFGEKAHGVFRRGRGVIWYRTECLKLYKLCIILANFADMAFPPHDQRHLWLHYHVGGYTEEIVHDFEQRLETIFGRQEVLVSHAWMRVFEIRAALVRKFFLEFFGTCRIGDEMGLDVAGLHTAEQMVEEGFGAYWLGIKRVISDKGILVITGLRLISYNIYGREQAPKKVAATILLYLRSMDQGAANVPYLLALSSLWSVSDDGLRGLSVVTRDIPLIDMGKLIKLDIYREIGDDWAWVASGPERQQVATDGTPEAIEDASAVDEGAQADLTLVHTPQPPPLSPTAGRTMPSRVDRLEEEM